MINNMQSSDFIYTHITKKGQLCLQAGWWPVKTNSPEGQAIIEREKRWPLMRLEDGRIMRIARRNLIKIELKKERTND